MGDIISLMDYNNKKKVTNKDRELLINLKNYITDITSDIVNYKNEREYNTMISFFYSFIDKMIISSSSIKINKYIKEVNNILSKEDSTNRKDVMTKYFDIILYSLIFDKTNGDILDYDFVVTSTIMNFFTAVDLNLDEFNRYLVIFLSKDIEEVILNYYQEKDFNLIFISILRSISTFNLNNKKTISHIRENLIKEIKYYYKNKKYYKDILPKLNYPLTEKNIYKYLDECLDFISVDLIDNTYIPNFRSIIGRFKKVFKYIPINYQEEFFQGIEHLINNNNDIVNNIQEITSFMEVILFNFEDIDTKIINNSVFLKRKRGKENEVQ